MVSCKLTSIESFYSIKCGKRIERFTLSIEQLLTFTTENFTILCQSTLTLTCDSRLCRRSARLWRSMSAGHREAGDSQRSGDRRRATDARQPAGSNGRRSCSHSPHTRPAPRSRRLLPLSSRARAGSRAWPGAAGVDCPAAGPSLRRRMRASRAPPAAAAADGATVPAVTRATARIHTRIHHLIVTSKSNQLSSINNYPQFM